MRVATTSILASRKLKARAKHPTLDSFEDEHHIPKLMRSITDSDLFNSIVCGIIGISCVHMGADTYDGETLNEVLDYIEVFVFAAFLVEFIMRVIAKGRKPWRFFTGPGWALNCFDFVILVVSIPTLEIPGHQVRVFRILRVGKLLHRSKRMRLMIWALIDSLRSIASIIILLLVVFYVYGVAGVITFRDNDPFHFGSLENAILTLFRCATMEDWTDVMYLNIYGCDHDEYAWIMPNEECNDPEASYYFGPAYFVSFTVVAGMVMISLFVGIVTMSMQLSLHFREAPPCNEVRRRSSLLRRHHRNSMFRKARRHSHISITNGWTIRGLYAQLGLHCLSISMSTWFTYLMTFIIILSGIVVGVRVEVDYESSVALDALELIIIIGFVLEVLIKLIAEGEHPKQYFRDNWNCFDFVVTAVSIIPDIGAGQVLFCVRLLRLLRVLRLIRQVTQLQVIVLALLKGFQSIGMLTALMILVFFVFAIIGIELFAENDPFHFGTLHQAMLTLFRCSTMEDWTEVMYTNMYGCDVFPAVPVAHGDAFFDGNEGYAGDGSEGYADDDDEGYDHDDGYAYGSGAGVGEGQGGDGGYDDFVISPSLGRCDTPVARGLAAAFYFVIFVMIGGLVLLSLFVGIVTAAMDEASTELAAQGMADDSLLMSTRQLALGDMAHVNQNNKKKKQQQQPCARSSDESSGHTADEAKKLQGVPTQSPGAAGLVDAAETKNDDETTCIGDACDITAPGQNGMDVVDDGFSSTLTGCEDFEVGIETLTLPDETAHAAAHRAQHEAEDSNQLHRVRSAKSTSDSARSHSSHDSNRVTLPGLVQRGSSHEIDLNEVRSAIEMVEQLQAVEKSEGAHNHHHGHQHHHHHHHTNASGHKGHRHKRRRSSVDKKKRRRSSVTSIPDNPQG